MGPRTGGSGERTLVLLVRYVLLPNRNVRGSSWFGCGISRRRGRRRCRGLLSRGRPLLLLGGRLLGRRSVGRVWERLLWFGVRGILDVGHGLFGLLALLVDQDEWGLVPQMGTKKHEDGLDLQTLWTPKPLLYTYSSSGRDGH